MPLFNKFHRNKETLSLSASPPDSDVENEINNPLNNLDQEPIRFLRLRILAMALIVSMGGLIFGYDTGQISGFVQMPDFIARFAGPSGSFSNWKEGLIVGLVSCGSTSWPLYVLLINNKFE